MVDFDAWPCQAVLVTMVVEDLGAAFTTSYT
jgi:hypothetical protein